MSAKDLACFISIYVEISDTFSLLTFIGGLRVHRVDLNFGLRERKKQNAIHKEVVILQIFVV